MLALTLILLVPALNAEDITVGDIEIHGNYSVTDEEVLYLLGIEKDIQFSEDDVTRGIKRLFRKGVFETIDVDLDDIIEGKIVVNIKEKPYVKEILFKGQDKLPVTFYNKRFPVKKGMVIEPDTIRIAKSKLLNALDRRGFPDSEVNISVSESDEPYRVKLTVDILENLPVYVSNIQIIGARGYREDQIKTIMRLKESTVYDQFKLEQDMVRIENFLKKKGHLKPVIGPYTYINGELLLGVRVGVRLSVDISGNSVITDRTIKKSLPFAEAGDVTDGLISEAVLRIKELYSKKSFSETSIVAVLTGSTDHPVVKFFIHEGPAAWVNEITIVSAAVSTLKLKEIMSTRQRKPFSPRELKKDIGRISEFFLALGYKDIEIAEPVVVRTNRRVNILIKIEEGPKVIYSDISFKVQGAVFSEAIESSIHISPGEPYNEVDITDSRRSVQRACMEQGYIFCEVKVNREFMGEDKVAIAYEIKEGSVFFFGKTIIKGNTKTRRPVLVRQLKYRGGEVLNPSLLIQSRQKLFRLGLFRTIDISPLQGEGDTADIMVTVDESAPGSISFGMGYGEYEKYRGFIDISYANLFGMNRRGSVRTEHSTLWSRFMVNYQEPYLLNYNLLSTTTVLFEKRKEKNIDTGEISYRIEKTIASTAVEKELPYHLKGSLGYSYSIITTMDVQDDVALTRDDTGTLAISSVIPGLVFDTRDNPFDPSIGIIANIKVKYATSVLGSETQFLKTTGRIGGYYPLHKKIIAAMSLRGGIAKGLDKTKIIPLVERFFLGGRNTVRGFGHDRLGPIGDNDNPSGGNSFLQWNAELRMKLAGNWRFVPFVDAGNVWIDPDDTSFNDLRFTAGAGLQYKTPVGPIRIDYGKKLDPKEGESDFKIHFSIGHAF
jgi:outer membrane protein insertion porin family